jgi:hypothetical protein
MTREHRDDYENVQKQWQYVTTTTNEGEYPSNPLQDNVVPLSQFIEFWQYLLPDKKIDIGISLFLNIFLPLTVHKYLIEVVKGKNNFNYIS